MQTENTRGKYALSRANALLAVMSVIIASGCAARSAPDGADVTAGVYEQAGFEFLRWNEGPTIMIWHDFLGHSGSSSTSGSSGSATDPTYRLRGYAESWDGHRFEWEAQTNDGETARFWIDGTVYDLSNGMLFIATRKGGGTDIAQLERDLSHVQPNASSCVAFAKSDPVLARLIGNASASGAASPVPTPLSNTATPQGSWVTYTNNTHRFSLRHPPGLDVPPAGVSESRGSIGDQIVFSVAEQDPYWLGCLLEGLGDCPVMERTELTHIGNPARYAIRIDGHIGSIGGRIPQQYVTYLVRESGIYYTFTLYALGLESQVEGVDRIWPLDQADVVDFERMMDTLMFRVGSRG